MPVVIKNPLDVLIELDITKPLDNEKLFALAEALDAYEVEESVQESIVVDITEVSKEGRIVVHIIPKKLLSYKQIFEMIGKSLGVSRDLKEVRPSLLKKLSRIDSFAALIRGIRIITSEHVRAAFSEVHFSSDKIKEAIGMKFTPLAEVISEVAEHYRKDH